MKRNHTFRSSLWYYASLWASVLLPGASLRLACKHEKKHRIWTEREGRTIALKPTKNARNTVRLKASLSPFIAETAVVFELLDYRDRYDDHRILLLAKPFYQRTPSHRLHYAPLC